MVCSVQVRAAGMVIRAGKLLVMAYDYPKGRIHALPGGGIEAGEFAPEALIREYDEELGVKIQVGPLRYVGEMMAREKIQQTLHLVFEARILQGQPSLNSDHTTAHSLQWLDLSGLNEYLLYPDIGSTILADEDENKTAQYLGNIMSRKWV